MPRVKAVMLNRGQNAIGCVEIALFDPVVSLLSVSFLPWWMTENDVRKTAKSNCIIALAQKKKQRIRNKIQ